MKKLFSIFLLCLVFVTQAFCDSGVPNNEIWYTSSDGNIVNPNAADVFGANIVSNAYENGLGKIVFDGDVTSIGEYAFYNTNRLTGITIPNSVTSIGMLAFSQCYGLTSITIPNSVTSVGKWVFSQCSNLTSITIGNGVTSIGERAFSTCRSLANIAVEAGNSTYDSRNDCNAIIETSSNTLIAGCKNTIVPNSVVRIENWAFFWCEELTSITIPNSVTTIGGYAFSH